MKKETFALYSTPFRRNVSKEAFKKKIVREGIQLHEFGNVEHVNVVNIPMFAVNKWNNLGKKEGIRETESLDKTEFGQKINGGVTTAELE